MFMKLSFPEVATQLQTFTVAEAAVVLRTDIKTIRQWIKQGRLQATRFGDKSTRIRLSVLERFLDDNTVKAG
jgi:excisionase family DNA binding protein